MATEQIRVVALLTCHNRRDVSLRCLRGFFGQAVPPSVSLGAVVVDDGSADGTAAAIATEFPEVQVISGSGTLFWAGGMALAERTAGDPDYVLWLNDDVVLDPDAVTRLLAVQDSAAAAVIVVGATRDPDTRDLTYSGLARSGRHPLRIRLVQPGTTPRAVDLFNGNVVLVPGSVRTTVGPIDGGFAHGHADMDYSLRARRLGVDVLLSPGTVGVCRRQESPAPWWDRTLPLRARVELILAPKGVPPRSSARYLRRHGGPAWPLWWASPYLKFVASLFRDALVRVR